MFRISMSDVLFLLVSRIVLVISLAVTFVLSNASFLVTAVLSVIAVVTAIILTIVTSIATGSICKNRIMIRDTRYRVGIQITCQNGATHEYRCNY